MLRSTSRHTGKTNHSKSPLDKYVRLACTVLSRLTVRPIYLHNALDGDLELSQPVPGRAVTGQTDKNETGEIGGVKYRLL